MFLSLLTLLFIGAKLFGAIDWSWPVVLSPILVYIGFIISLVVLVALKGIRR